MRRSRMVALVLGGLLLAGKLASSASSEHPDHARLQGSWEILSVEREGQVELDHVGAMLTFQNNVVAFQQRIYKDGDVPTLTIKTIDEAAMMRMAFS